MPDASHHPIHLCQPDEGKSCGACCGLYNWKNHSRAAIEAILELQTELFSPFQNSENDFDRYRELRAPAIDNEKLFETIYNCEFIGFIDPERRRVGCMLHPMVTGGRDLRDHCFYGAEICSGHFCPGYSCFNTAQQRSVVQATGDWYLYGLTITDIDLVKEFFKHAENAIGESIKEKRLNFFKLKEHWPFKARENRLGKYYFSAAEYHVARIEYEKRWGLPPSRFDKILVSLESELATQDDVRSAERIIQGYIDRFIAAYTVI
ncbi:MAG: hypothetical protein NTX06_08275 [Proteobacteria bacterium]|nr:hypothetical protein [Pseudomonadota bacterium]